MPQNPYLVSLVLATFFFVIMILMNVLANTLPIGGITTGAVSDKYPNLFQPTGATFSIWGIIYLLLGIFLVSQMTSLSSISAINSSFLIKLNYLFTLTSIINVLWLFAWHYDRIGLSVILMLVLLVLLAWIALNLKDTGRLSQAAFGIYFGWITVATIANITIWLVKIGIPHDTNFSIVLTSIILIIGVLITAFVLVKTQLLFYGIVILWAYAGILIRHLSENEFNRGFPLIYSTTIFSLIIVLATVMFVFLYAKK
jgi:hypothetical protein